MPVRSETRSDGSRLCTRSETGERWIERDTGPGRVERTYVDAPVRYAATLGHSAVIERPAAVEPVVQAPGAPPAATPKAAAKPKPPAPVRRDTGGGRVAVRVVPEVVADIRSSVFWRNVGRDRHHEVGGWLCGGYDGRDLWITGATEAIEKATPTSLRLDLAAIDGLKSKERFGLNHAVIGAYHSHPGGGLLPSTADYRQLEDMVAWLEDTGSPERYGVSLIVGSNGRSLTDLSADVWVCCRENGGFVSEPGRLVLEP